MKPTYEIRLLGGCEVWSQGQPVTTFRTQKTRVLLAYLALQAPQAVSRKALAALFWPDSPPQRASHNLRQALTFLRQALPLDPDKENRSPLHTTRQQISFNPTPQIKVDALTFLKNSQSADIAALETAVQHYRGPLLSGVFIDDASPEFEIWLTQTRQHYQHKALTTLEKIADFYINQGDHKQAQTSLFQALDLAPWQESTHRNLIRAMVLSGDTAAALQQYETCVNILETELAVAPSAETERLVEQIRAGEIRPFSPARFAPTEQAPTPPFVGRGAEHAQLTAAFKTISHPQSAAIFIAGEVGAGKTRLITEFTQFAYSQQALILTGRCFEFGGTVPYQPWVDALRLALKIDTRPPSLAAVWLAELSRLLPELIDIYPDLPQPAAATGSAARQRLFAAVSRFIQGLVSQKRPIILFLDDLHWADTSTLDLLHYLIRQSRSLPILFLGAYRPEETPADHPLTILRRGLSRDRLATAIELDALTPTDIQLIADKLVSTEHAAQLGIYLRQESEGNPFVLTESLNTLFESGILQPTRQSGWSLTADWQDHTLQMSINLRDTILNRVERLPRHARTLLQTAAVIGRTFTPDLLHAITQTTPTQIEDHLAIWQERKLIQQLQTVTPHGQYQYDFTHDKIREVVYHQISHPHRQTGHKQIAQYLAHQAPPAAHDSTAAPTIAHHYLHSDTPHLAIPFLLTAAQHAQQVLAFTTTIRFCHQALKLQPHDPDTTYTLLSLRQEASEYLGDSAQEEADALAMLEIGQTEQNSRQTMRAYQRLAIYYMHRDPPKAQEIIGRVLPLYQATTDQEGLAHVLLVAAILSRNKGDTAEAYRLFQQSQTVAHQNSDPQSEGFSLGYIAFEQIRRGLLAPAIDNYKRGAVLLRSVNEQSIQLGYHLIGTTNLYRILGDYSAATAAIEETWQIGQILEHTGIQCWVHLHRGKIALWQEHYDEAQHHYQTAHDVAEAHQFNILKAHAYWGLGYIALFTEKPQQAQEELQQALALFRNSHTEMTMITHAFLAWATALNGDQANAQSHITTAVQAITENEQLFVEGQQIYLCYAQLLAHTNQPAASYDAHQKGQQLLLTKAAQLDPQAHSRFTTAGPINQQLSTVP